jgi:hypothetical protein
MAAKESGVMARHGGKVTQSLARSGAASAESRAGGSWLSGWPLVAAYQLASYRGGWRKLARQRNRQKAAWRCALAYLQLRLLWNCVDFPFGTLRYIAFAQRQQ